MSSRPQTFVAELMDTQLELEMRNKMKADKGHQIIQLQHQLKVSEVHVQQ